MNPKFIAEVSSNHHRDIDRCMTFIRSAAGSGCDAVKFQLFKIDELFAGEILTKSKKHQQRKDWELPLSFLPKLKQCCSEYGIEFSCTPFYLKAVDELLPYVDFYKVASYELLWDDLLIACAKTGKPIVLSTGMATIEEVDHAVNVLRANDCIELTLLHCVSAYPTPANECNLAVIDTFRQRYNCKVGWSDHSVSPPVLLRAASRWRADTIEFHLDLDGQGEEYASGHCWLPEQIRQVIQDTKTLKLADGDGIKHIAKSEKADRSWRADPSDGLRPLRSVRVNFDG